MTSNYYLEIYEPDSLEVITSFESDTPFLGIGVGDVLNPNLWENVGYKNQHLLKVINVEHIIWGNKNGSDCKHKVLLYTKLIPNDSDSRLKS